MGITTDAILALAAAGFLAIPVVLVLVRAGIRSEDPRAPLAVRPATPAASLSRRLSGVHVLRDEATE
jgi:hypothetical protein